MLCAFVYIKRLCYNSIVPVSLSKLLIVSLLDSSMSTQGLLTHPVILSSKYLHISTAYRLHWYHCGLKSHHLPHRKIEILSNQCPLQSFLPPPPLTHLFLTEQLGQLLYNLNQIIPLPFSKTSKSFYVIQTLLKMSCHAQLPPLLSVPTDDLIGHRAPLWFLSPLGCGIVVVSVWNTIAPDVCMAYYCFTSFRTLPKHHFLSRMLSGPSLAIILKIAFFSPTPRHLFFFTGLI